MDEIKVPMAKPVFGDEELNGIVDVVNSKIRARLLFMI